MLLDELQALLEIAPLRLLLWFALVGVLVWLLAVAIPIAVRIAWQLGIDARRRLTIASTLARVLAPIVALLGIMEPFFTRAPALSLIGLFALGGLALMASPSSARNLAAGLSLALRPRFRIGDLIRIAEFEGTVDAIGLTRISLRTREGGVTLIPAADFERLPVTIGSHGAAVPVEVEHRPQRPLDEAALERVRRALWFSPFRRAGTEIRLTCDPDSGRLHVAIDTWAAGTSVELERHVRELLRSSEEPSRATEASEEEETA